MVECASLVTEEVEFPPGVPPDEEQAANAIPAIATIPQANDFTRAPAGHVFG
jgi:hypothetical protein